MKNVIHKHLIKPSKVLSPPLHIKLGRMEHFVNALNVKVSAFTYLFGKIPQAHFQERKNTCVYWSSNQTTFLKTSNLKQCEVSRREQHGNALKRFRTVFRQILNLEISENLYKIWWICMNNFFGGSNMSLKIHFLFLHLDFFPLNFGDVSDKHAERFHQDIGDVVQVQKKWSAAILGDYCWKMKMDVLETL
jgi:hypothetical protein